MECQVELNKAPQCQNLQPGKNIFVLINIINQQLLLLPKNPAFLLPTVSSIEAQSLNFGSKILHKI